MRHIEFHDQSFSEFQEWLKIDKKIYARIIRLVEETQRDPFGGIGKPEPLNKQQQNQLLHIKFNS